MSRPAILVLARLDSRRLPGKALRTIAGRPLLGRVLDRVRRTPGDPVVVVATSTRPVDDPIAAFAEDEDVAVFRGDAGDVAGRCLACAERFAFDRIVRISGDSPFIDPGLIGAAHARSIQADAPDLVTNLFPRTYPPGVSVEVLTAAALRRLLGRSAQPADREHVTPYVYRHPEEFRLVNLAAPDNRYAGVALTVDTPDDLAKAAWITGQLEGRAAEADLGTVVALARRWPGPGRS